MMKSVHGGAAICILVSFFANSVTASELGQFRNTEYHVAMESDFPPEPADVPILDMNEIILAKVGTIFKRAMDMEGTGKLRDGRVLNFAGRKEGQIRYRFTTQAWGMGVGNCALVPFHTVAVDPREIPLGATVQISETRGMKLPDGTPHNGLWRAEDIGSAIQGDRIDLFIGESKNNKFLLEAGITFLRPLTIQLVTPPAPNSCVYDSPSDL